jgi:hypothetical protein
MRIISVAFWSSNALLLAAGGAFAWTRLHAAPMKRKTPSEPPVRVESFVPHELSAANAQSVAEAAGGWIAFRVDPGESVAGIVTIRVFPVSGGAPALTKGADLSATQIGGRIDAKPWLRQQGVPTDAFLFYDVLVRDEGGREQYRRGWTRFDVISLRTSGIIVDAPVRQSAVIDVRTKEGCGIPGALIVVDPTDMVQTGLASQFAVTSDDGSVKLSGLERGVRYRAELADGVGPDLRSITTVVDGGASRYELRVDLSGKWEFVRHKLTFAIAGASTRAKAIVPQDAGCPGVWPVSRWVPPGRGLDAPFWIMIPVVDDPHAVPASLEFANRGKVVVPDLRLPTRFLFSPYTTDVKVADARSDSARSGPSGPPASQR